MVASLFKDNIINVEMSMAEAKALVAVLHTRKHLGGIVGAMIDSLEREIKRADLGHRDAMRKAGVSVLPPKKR